MDTNLDLLPDSHRIWQSKHWRIRHSDETDLLGYCILEPRRHFLDMSDANAEEIAEYAPLLSRLMKAVRKYAPGCERVYTFSLGESVSHYHLHVIPRSTNFPLEYKARGIMSYPLTPAADPEQVEVMRAKFAAHLQDGL